MTEQFAEIVRERRRNTDKIKTRLDAGKERMDDLEAAIKENTVITAGIKADTAEIIDFFASAKGAFKVLEWIGSVAKPISYIAMLVSAVGGVFMLFKNGGGK